MISPAYFDYAAAAPLDLRVARRVAQCLSLPGNPNSAHRAGRALRDRIERARSLLARAVGSCDADVVFTSGAPESNHLALLGLASRAGGRGHIVSTAIEHASVRGTVAALQRRGFDVDLVAPNADGAVDAAEVVSRVRPDTVVVSVMHVNNETGVIQPVTAIADALAGLDVPVHVDAAQSVSCLSEELAHPGIDLISASAHKLHGPAGVGALIRRGRAVDLPPVVCGGAPDGGVRPGTPPAALIDGFGLAVDLALRERDARGRRVAALRERVVREVEAVGGRVVGAGTIAGTVCFRVPGLEAETLLMVLGDLLCASAGSACSAGDGEPSYVLRAMGLSPTAAAECMRLSFGHDASDADWSAVRDRVDALRSRLAA